jgi:transposase
LHKQLSYLQPTEGDSKVKKKYNVDLTTEEQAELENRLRGGRMVVRNVKRIQILLKANKGWSDERIAEALDVGLSTVERTRRKFVERGLEGAIKNRRPRREYPRKLDGRAEAHLIALVCGPAPAGYARWSLRLLADELVKIEGVEVESISHEAVRQTLKKTNLSLGAKKNG